MQKGSLIYSISYKPLWDLLMRRGISRTAFAQAVGLHIATINDMRRNMHVDLAVIERICAELDCELGDVLRINKVEVVPAQL